MKKQITIIFCLLFTLISAVGQDVRFRSTSSKKQVALNETLKFTITIENVVVKDFKPPQFKDFEAYGPSQQSSYNMFNGKVTQSKSFTYTLKPTKVGDFVIDAATGKIDGKAVKTNPISIKVGEATQNTQNNTSSNGNNRGNNYSNNNSNTPRDIQSQLKEKMFVRVIPDKTTVFKGEQVTLTYKVYYSVRFRDVQVTKAPAYNGFLSQEIELSEDAQTEQIEQYNGKRYTVQTFKRVALFPSRDGNLTIEPMELEGTIMIQKRDAFFNHPFFTTSEPYNHKFNSNTLKINVKPLPTNAPLAFTGAVGKYDFSVEADKTETDADDPITLKVKIKGEGNIKLIDLKKPELPQSFEVYDPKIKESISKKSTKIRGSKTYEYLIIPRAGGTYEIPRLTFSFFDLNTKKYITKNSEALTINVKGDAATVQSNSNTGLSKEEIKLLGDDIRYIKQGALSNRAKGALIKKPVAIAGWVLPLLLLIPLVFVRAQKKKEWSDTITTKRKKAGKEASKRLSAAKKLMLTEEDKPFYDEILRTIWTYCSDKLNIDPSDLSKLNIREQLINKNVNEETIGKLKVLIDSCEMSLFAGLKDQSKDQVYSDAESIINELENQLKS